MKKILLFVLVSLLLIGCSSDDDNTDTGKDSLIYIETKFDKGEEAPEGDVFLFYLDNVNVTSEIPIFAGSDGTCALRDVNNEYVLPVYKTKLIKNKDQNTGKYINLSSVMIDIKSLSVTYGTPKKDGKYLLAIQIWRPTEPSNSGYSKTYKRTSFGSDMTKMFKLYPDDLDLFNGFYDEW